MKQARTSFCLLLLLYPSSFLLLFCVCGCGGGRGTLACSQKLLPAAAALRQEPPPDAARELNRQFLPPYTASPGDVLLVQAANFESPLRLPGDQPVLPDGSIQLGPHGRIIVAGKTLEQIEAEVRAVVLAQTQVDPGPVVARVVSRQGLVFYVLGEVHSPGAFPLAGRETVLDAILMAGGLTDRADGADIILTRPTPPGCRPLILPVCYPHIVQLGDTTTNYQVGPGDRIFVPVRCPWDELWHHGH
jgi:polysaccharide export outer membrane protein